MQLPLLDVLRISPDFRPAYDFLLRMAAALAWDDPLASKALVAEMAAIQQSGGGPRARGRRQFADVAMSPRPTPCINGQRTGWPS